MPRVDFRVHSLHARGRPRIGPDATAENQTVIHFGLIGAQRGTATSPTGLSEGFFVGLKDGVA